MCGHLKTAQDTTAQTAAEQTSVQTAEKRTAVGAAVVEANEGTKEAAAGHQWRKAFGLVRKKHASRQVSQLAGTMMKGVADAQGARELAREGKMGVKLPPPNATGSNPTLLLHSPVLRFHRFQPVSS